MELSLEKILKIIWKNLLILLLAAVVCAGAVFAFTKLAIPKTYVSRIGFTVISTASDTNVANPSYLNSNLSYTREIVHSKIVMLDTLDYFAMVAENYNALIEKIAQTNPDKLQGVTPKNAGQIAAATSFSVIEDTELFTVSVRTNSPYESYYIAEAIKNTANDRLTDLAKPENYAEGDITVTDTVRTYMNPVMGSFAGPNVFMNTCAGFFAGFAIAFVIILIINIMDTRVKSLTDLSEKYKDIPILGTVASFETAKK